MIDIEIGYATPQQQRVIPLTVAAGCTVEAAILQSGILTHFPEIDLRQQPVGIFAKVVSLLHRVTKGDRIEIYRPLTIDPKQARKMRAQT